MLIVKGHAIDFDFTDGASLSVAASHAMMHDPTGHAWPRCSVLIAPYTRGTEAPQGESESVRRARDYYGRSYPLHVGRVSLPARALSGWRRVGEVSRIYYKRPGHRRPGSYQHPMTERRKYVVFGKKGRATVYVRGRFVRLELPAGCMLDDRGYVWP